MISIPRSDQHAMLNSILAKDKRWKLSYSVQVVYALITIHTSIATRVNGYTCSSNTHRGPEDRNNLSGF